MDGVEPAVVRIIRIEDETDEPICVAPQGGELDSCAQAIPIIRHAHQLQDNPVMVVPGPIHEQLRLPIQNGDNDVNFTIVVQVAKSRAAVRGRSGKVRVLAKDLESATI